MDFLKAVLNNNQEIINDINSIITEGFIKVTYIPGNHDLIFSYSDINFLFPGIFQARDAFGLGRYTPKDLPILVIEHGHRYDFFCAPYNISENHSISFEVLPPGYFYARITATSLQEGFPNTENKIIELTYNKFNKKDELLYLYWSIWIESLKKYPIYESYNEKIIKATINNYEDYYSVNDFLPYQLLKDGSIYLNKFKEIIDTWNERQLLNDVSILSSVKESLTKSISHSYIDKMSQVQYFNNQFSNKRIVIFGHTHYPCLQSYINNENRKCIYANCGSWLDNSITMNMTFVVISPKKDHCTSVTLYKFTSNCTIEKINSASLINTNI